MGKKKMLVFRTVFQKGMMMMMMMMMISLLAMVSLGLKLGLKRRVYTFPRRVPCQRVGRYRRGTGSKGCRRRPCLETGR